jgi:hypothetical protein
MLQVHSDSVIDGSIGYVPAALSLVIYLSKPCYCVSCRQIKLIKKQEVTILDLQGQLDLAQGCTNPRHQVARLTWLCTVMPNVCGSSVWNFSHTYNFDVGHSFLEKSCTRALAYFQNSNWNTDINRGGKYNVCLLFGKRLKPKPCTKPKMFMSLRIWINCNVDQQIWSSGCMSGLL